MYTFLWQVFALSSYTLFLKQVLIKLLLGGRMYDIVIIGSGPAGLSASVYSSRAQLKTVVAEKINGSAGQISDSEQVDNYLGLYGESGFEIGEKFRNHALALGAEFYDGEAVSINKTGNAFTVEFADKSKLETKAVVYAAGTSRRKLEIKGESEFTGKGVSYCAVCDGAFYKNKTAVVIGGGDTALGDALLLSRMSEKVYLIHRRNEFRGSASLQEKVRSTENIEIILNAVPTEIAGDNKVNSLKILHDGKEEKIFTDGIFVAVGTVPNSGLLKDFVKLDKNGYVIADEDGITSIAGFFAAGDVRTKVLRQVATAVSDGANCIYSAEKYISEVIL